MSIQQQAAVKAVTDLTDSLPAEGQIEVLKYPTNRDQFSEVYAGEHCKLEVRSARLGREVRLTINAGSTLEKVFDEINQKSQEKYGRDAIYRGTMYNNQERREMEQQVYGRAEIYRGTLYADEGVNDVLKETKVIIFTPVIENSEDKVKFGNALLGNASHDALLKENGMDWVDRPYITAATGAFRVAEGFPEDARLIGSTTDKGDLLKGMVARARSGSVRSFDDGVDVWGGPHSDSAQFLYVAAAGTFIE